MTEATANFSRVDVRVNPQNGDFRLDDPEYVKTREEEFEQMRAALVVRMLEEVEAGEREMSGADILIHSYDVTQRATRLKAVLGGYGLVGESEGMGYYGVDIQWVPDEDVPVGEFELEVEDPQATFRQLMSPGQ